MQRTRYKLDLAILKIWRIETAAKSVSNNFRRLGAFVRLPLAGAVRPAGAGAGGIAVLVL
jgi:hypothetical protein